MVLHWLDAHARPDMHGFRVHAARCLPSQLQCFQSNSSATQVTRRQMYTSLSFLLHTSYQTAEQPSCVISGLSVALFAPGWVYEGAGNDRSAWRQLDQQFWDNLAAVLPAPRPAIAHLPFASDFNAGYGAALHSEVRSCTSGIAPGVAQHRPRQQPPGICTTRCRYDTSCGMP